MPNLRSKLVQFGLRAFWEPVALVLSLLAAGIPVLLIAGLVAWNASDPGCACYSQKVVLSRVKIEEHQIIICALAGVAALGCWLLLRRFRMTARDLLDVLFCACVFAGVYFGGSLLFKDLPTPSMWMKVPFETLVPVKIQQGFFVPYFPEPYFYPWRALFSAINTWQFFAATTVALLCFFVFGESFGFFEKLKRRKVSQGEVDA